MIKGSKLSDLVVEATVGAGLLYLIFSVFGIYAAVGFTIYLIFEGYTLMNRYPEDTLSESVWRLSARPLVPWLFGAATMYAIMAGYFGPVDLALRALGIGFLQGHFFFQSYRSKGNSADSTSQDSQEEHASTS